MKLYCETSLFIILLLWSVLAEFSASTEPVNCTANTAQGVLVGTEMSSLFGRQFCAFLGVPYAQPPVRSLRFREPHPPTKWTGILNATTKSKLCSGISFSVIKPAMDEDCLYLDIYTPKLEPKNNSTNFSVLVFIPDDTYLGDESYLYGPDYLMDTGIILIVVNYRVGIFGFLSTGNAIVSGNFGFKDQVQALRWIQNNIRSFGGDSSSVTIHGHGAGGASVHYHLLSPSSKGLFHRAISQSGSALNPNMRPISNPKKLVQELGKITRCPTNDDVVLTSCLQGLDQHEFSGITTINFGPVVEPDTELEEHFLTKHPLDIIRSSQINNVPWLMGTVCNEGAVAASDLLTNRTAILNWNDNPDDVLAAPSILRLAEEQHFMDANWSRVLDFYLSEYNHSIFARNTTAVMKLYGDRLYNFGIHMSAVLHSLHGHTEIYKYDFAFDGKSHFRKYVRQLLRFVGAGHGDDLLYIFRLPMLEVFPPGQPEIEVITKMTTVLSDFVKTGNPTASEKFNVTWEPVGPTNLQQLNIKYMSMSAANPSSFEGLNLTMETDLYKDRMDFWLTMPLAENFTLSSLSKSSGSVSTSLPSRSVTILNIFIILLAFIVL